MRLGDALQRVPRPVLLVARDLDHLEYQGGKGAHGDKESAQFCYVHMAPHVAMTVELPSLDSKDECAEQRKARLL
jgi:hypothetical protein